MPPAQPGSDGTLPAQLWQQGIITLQLPLSIHSVVGFQQPAPTHTSTTASHQNVPAAVPACMCGCRQQCHM